MAASVKEWVQREWLRPGIDLYAKKGDFFSVYDLYPDLTEDNQRLKRGPAWSSAQSYPGSGSTAFHNVEGGFFDEVNERRVIVGRAETSGDAYTIGCFYLDSSFSPSSKYDLVTDYSNLGGLTGRNVAWWGGNLYIIASNGDVYRGSSYTSALASFYTGSDARILAPYGDRMYMVVDDGQVYRLNDGDTAFESFYNPLSSIDIRFIAAYRHYLVLIGAGDDGIITLYRLPDNSPQTLHTLAQLPGDGKLPTPTTAGTDGCLYAVYRDKIYFVAGRDRDDAAHDWRYQIYAFNGTWIEQLGPTLGAGAAGFLHWKGRLFLHHCDGDKHYFQCLIGDKFTETDIYDCPQTAITPALSLGSELFIFNDNSGTETYYHQGSDGYSNGILQSSYLDFDHPGKPKRLESITVLLDSIAATTRVYVFYRKDDESSFTNLGSTDGTARIHHSGIGAIFYRLQVQVTAQQTSGDNTQFGIQALSVVYTVSI